MDIILAILAITGFITGCISLISVLCARVLIHAQIQAEMSARKVEVAGMESRIEGALNLKIEKALQDIRQTVQGDAFDLVQNTLTNIADTGSAGSQGMDIANFNHFGD